MNKQELKWHLARIKAMSIGEVFYRIKTILINKIAERNTGRFFNSFSYKGYIKVFDSGNVTCKVNTNTYKIFDQQINLNNAINWHYDPFSGNSYPLIFAKKIKTRGFNNMSAKHVWEINRMQFLPLLALEYKQSGKKEKLDQIIRIIKSWAEENPYMLGINWYSNIELGLRLIIWALTWDMLDMKKLIKEQGELEAFNNETWLPLIFAHCKRIRSSLSLYSSANNHLIAELAGLFIASSFWKFGESDKWKVFSKKRLEKEIIKQHSVNGINHEQTSGYIQYITDLFLLCYFYADRTNNTFSEKYSERLHEIFKYVSQLVDTKGNTIRYGDADDGHAFFLENDDHVYNFRSLLTTGAILFSNKSLRLKCAGYDGRNQLFFGDKYKANFDNSENNNQLAEESKFYPDEGHFFFKKQSEKNETLLYFDAAQLGYLSIAAHGHADALSYLLHVDGNPIIVDNGTYTIHTQQDFRKYFKGTLAHNTIRVDKKDQAEYGGPSLWNNHFKPKVLSYRQNDGIEEVAAEHNGYLKEGVLHERKVKFDKNNEKITIIDMLETKNDREHLFEICHHLSPDVKVNRNNNILELQKEGARKVIMKFDPKLNIQIIRGQKEPILGFYSNAMYELEETTVVYSKLNTSKTVILETEIIIES